MPNSGIDALLSVNNLTRLGQGLAVTLKLSIISIAISLALGLIYGIAMTTKNKLLYGLLKLYLEAFRVIPLLVWLFLLFFGGARAFGADTDGFTASVIVFSMWGTVEMGDIIRGAVQSIPACQRLSAEALGMTKARIYRHVIIPQAVRRFTPAAINLVTRMIKTSSLAVFVGVTEILRVGKQIIEFNMMKNPMASFWIYAFIFVVYFIICYPVSRLSKRLEAKWEY
ncbi:MAG: amino acid ABC transporter permease [Clostridiales bacterium]|jgi:polar amino acid transport system permease protein|nr:amino acid ABC transporter permease [Clostridiales bacterium]